MSYKCVIFDVGYTLVKHDDEKETKMMSSLLNIPYSQDFKNEISNFWKKSAEYTNDLIITEEKYLKILKKMFPIINKYNIPVYDFYKALSNKGQIGIYDDVIEILQWLKNKNIELVTLSNWFEENQKEELKKLNIYNFFSNVYGWDDSYAKPHPQIVNSKILSKYYNEEVLFVGDGLEKDIKCAIRAGIDSCWINRDNKINTTTVKPTYKIKNLLQMKKLM